MPIVRIAPDKLTGDIRRRQKALRFNILQDMREGAKDGRNILEKRTPKGVSSILADSWEVSHTADGAVLMNETPYAGIVEKGARPHGVSEEGRAAIRQWVAFKVFGKRVARAKRPGTREKFEKRIDAMTQGIIEKLQRVGQEPTFFVRRRMRALNTATRTRIRRSIAQIAKQR